MSDLKSKNSVSSTKTKISISDFAIGKTLGEGKFGTVNVVKHKKT